MVSPNNPLKDKNILKDEQIRLSEAREAIEQDESRPQKGKIIVSDFECSLPRPNYTANTLRKLRESYPNDDFTLIIGEDNLSIFSQWREHLYILENYRIMVYPRSGCGAYEIPLGKELVILKDAPKFDISSTEIREKQQNKEQEAKGATY